jgi:predicted MPP superfamily phosphohydrolase
MALLAQLLSSSSSFTWRCLVRWHLGLNVFLVLAAVGLGTFVFRRAFFFLILVPIAFIPFSYTRLRLHRFLEPLLTRHRQASRLFALFAIVGIGLDAFTVAQLLTARIGTSLVLLHGPGIAWAGAIWFSAHGLLFLGYVAIGIARLGERLLKRVISSKAVGTTPSSPPVLISPERRQFLQHLGVLGAGVPFFISLSNIKLSYDFRIEEREIMLPHWPRSLDGLRIAHLSDIHVGKSMNRERLLRIAALTNRAQPDLVFHTGDFLTHLTGDFDAPLYEALARIRAPYGQWACLGNHDFDAPERLVRRLSQAGVTTLRNTLVTLHIHGQPLEVAGLDFLFRRSGIASQQTSYRRIVNSWGARGSRPRLLLNHDPRTFVALPRGCADLVFCGHTHGGHIGIQLGRNRALTVVGLCGIPDQGIFRRKDMYMYVTRCVGFYGYPMRLGIPPEIALLTLRAPAASHI